MGSDDIASLNFPEYSGNLLGKNLAKVILVEDEDIAAVLWDRLKDVVLEKAPNFQETNPILWFLYLACFWCVSFDANSLL